MFLNKKYKLTATDAQMIDRLTATDAQMIDRLTATDAQMIDRTNKTSSYIIYHDICESVAKNYSLNAPQ